MMLKKKIVAVRVTNDNFWNIYDKFWRHQMEWTNMEVHVSELFLFTYKIYSY